jgi:hypothetical protein
VRDYTRSHAVEAGHEIAEPHQVPAEQRSFVKGKLMRRHLPVALLLALATTVSGVAGAAGVAQAGTKHAATKTRHSKVKHATAIVPLPKALANHPFAKAWTGAELAASAWNAPSNDPGNCAPNPSQVSVNSSGYAELTTNGDSGNCVAIQSPHTYPTVDGYVYEADVYFSSWENGTSFWMYGPDWPVQGEIDSVEASFDNNYVTWHQGANDETEGTGPGQDQEITPTGANISPGWHVIDIAFGGNRIQLFYDGQPYITLPETLTATTDDPMFIVFSEGSCEQQGFNACENGTLGLGVAGNMQIKYLRAFLPPK